MAQKARIAVGVPMVAALALGFSGVQVTAAGAASAAGAAKAQFAYQGEAFGSLVNVGHKVRSGPSAPVYLGCTTTAGLNKMNSTAGVNLAPVLVSGTITSTANTSASPVTSRTTSTVQGVNALRQLITATAVHSVSATSHTSTGFHVSAAGTSFTKLVIARVPFSVQVAPNTRVNLAGIGHVIINEQMSTIGPRSASLTVNALHLVVDHANALGVAIGTNVIVGHAASGLSGPVRGTLDGKAYGTSVKLGKVVKSGPSFLIPMPCTGTQGILRKNTGAGVTVPDLLASGTVTDTVRGTVNATTAMGETTSTLQSANVLRGLVTAKVIKADAHAAKTTGGLAFSDAGSRFGTLSVNGHPAIGANVAPNTQVRIAGLGTLYLHRVIHQANSIEVRMIELVVTQTNPQGLPIGSDIRVAVAEASAH